MEFLKFCGIFASLAVQIVGRDERTPYFTKKSKNISDSRDLLIGNIFERILF